MQLAIFLVFAFLATAFSAKYLSVQERIEGSYFVVFKDVVTQARGTDLRNEILHMDDSNVVEYVYEHVVNGFAATLTPESIEQVMKMDEVDYIEENGRVHAYQSCSSYSGSGSWGLRAVSNNAGCGTGSQSNLVVPSTGSGVRAYIIDTGIRSTHNDFGGRVPTGTNNCYSAISGGCEDCNGHGTHVASTTGGATYGIAKSATLYSVRVLSCSGSGSNAGVVAGIDWSRGHCSGRCVINMSLGGGASTTTDNAVNACNNAGIFVAVAAGNSNENACNSSPARATGAYTVGATTQSTSSDPRASYSNYGTCLNIFAPGSSITAAWYTSNTATNTISGTSMASPHVAGVAASLWGANSGWSLSQLKSALGSYGRSGCVTNPGTGSPNVQLKTGC